MQVSLKMQDTKIAKNSPSAHHRTTLSGYVFATKACIDDRKQILFNSNISSKCSHNMVNFSPLTAERSVWAFAAPQQISMSFAADPHVVGGQVSWQFRTLNTHHIYTIQQISSIANAFTAMAIRTFSYSQNVVYIFNGFYFYVFVFKTLEQWHT